METVFITIHDLSLDARIKYASDSVEDILGYTPDEVKGKSCWEYFHPDEIPFARAIHGRGIHLDKAASLNYCQIKHRDGHWVGCECVFTVVCDVLVASTAIYKRGERSRQRAIDGAGIRRIFSSSPRDPRYHMLSFISHKFYKEPDPHAHEPRAALFLNRFTRTSTVMFSTNGVTKILGIRPEQLVGKSFYFCIAENCLKDAVRCLESAKANDSIAYLRFWYRDPLQDDRRVHEALIPDGPTSDDEDDDGGVPIPIPTDATPAETPPSVPRSEPQPSIEAPAPLREGAFGTPLSLNLPNSNSRTSSGNSTDLDGDAADTIFDRPAVDRSSTSLTPAEDHGIEIEAVVSCSSDGLVVVLRRAQPLVPGLVAAGTGDVSHYANGVFASPWAPEPVMPENAPASIPPEAAEPPGQEPEPAGFMRTIREISVFAWSLTGINGSIAQYGRGTPTGEALPPGGLPVWDPNSGADPENKYNGFMGGSHRPLVKESKHGEKAVDKEETSSSEDEVVWKRVPVIPVFRRPARRRRDEAFGDGSVGREAEEREERATQRRKMGNGTKE